MIDQNVPVPKNLTKFVYNIYFFWNIDISY